MKKILHVGAILGFFALLGCSNILSQWNTQFGSQDTARASSSTGGLVAEWELNEQSGTTISPQFGSIYGTSYGGVSSVSDRLGKTGAMSFDGTDDFIQLHRPAVNTNASYTVSAWAKMAYQTDGYRTVVSQLASNVSGFYLQRTQDNHWAFTTYENNSINSTVYRAKSNAPVATNQWYHLVGVYDHSAGKIRLYVNGVLNQEVRFTSRWNATWKTNIGRARWDGEFVDFFKGEIDDVRIYNTALSAGEVSALNNPQQIGHWPFNNSAATTGIANNNGTVHGATYVNGWVGQALRFDGNNDYVNIPSYGNLNTAEDYTVMAYVNTDALGENRTVVSKNAGQVSGFYLQLADDNHWAFSMYGGDAINGVSWARAASRLPAKPNIWYHLAAVHDSRANTIRLYVNGELQQETSFSDGFEAWGDISVGRGKWNGGFTDYFDGMIDDVKIHRSAFTTGAIQEVYNLRPSVPSKVYLMAWFDSDAEGDAADENMYYAYSTDALNWTYLKDSQNRPEVVFAAYNKNGIRLRDPYMQYVNGKYHLVHTWGWDNKEAFHWESTDGINWTGANGGTTTDDGKFQAVPANNTAPNAWAPEFYYDGTQFYVFWTSRNYDLNGDGRVSSYEAREKIFYRTTTDWLTFSEPAILFDPGFAVIDLTVIKEGNTIYGYYKNEYGAHGQRHILQATGSSITTLSGAVDVNPSVRGVEGPEIIKTIDGSRHILYYDFFGAGYWGASVSTDTMNTWRSVSTNFPPNASHGSVTIVNRSVVSNILNHYNDPVPAGW